MTHLEKLKKIKARVGDRVSLTDVSTAWQVRKWIALTHEGTEILSQAPSPEEAVDIAFNELFPPTPKEVGCWSWCEKLGKWRCSGWSTGESLWVMRQATAHVPVYLLGGSSISHSHEAQMTTQHIQDLLKLIGVNPELRAPTEE